TILVTSDGSSTVIGNQFLEFAGTGGIRISVPNYYHYLAATGIRTGGVVSETGGLNVSVSAGTGIIERSTPAQSVRQVTWATTPLTLADNTTNYVFYDGATNLVTFGPAPPGNAGIL